MQARNLIYNHPLLIPSTFHNLKLFFLSNLFNIVCNYWNTTVIYISWPWISKLNCIVKTVFNWPTMVTIIFWTLDTLFCLLYENIRLHVYYCAGSTMYFKTSQNDSQYKFNLSLSLFRWHSRHVEQGLYNWDILPIYNHYFTSDIKF